jgi:glycosyltransferase involved in cell wall biosynthesis
VKIAILTPWILTFGGAEKVVAVLSEMFPEADIFSMFQGKADLPPSLAHKTVKTSFLNGVPGIWKLYRPLLGLHSFAVESLDLRGYKLVISCDAGLVKGVLIDQDALHICYCHTPIRYIWDLYWTFSRQLPSVARPFYAAIAQHLRIWDFNAAQRVDYFIANSKYIQQRIFKYYRRTSFVIYPPVEADSAFVVDGPKDYYLSVGRLTHTKRLDLLVHACNRLKRRLVIVGSGREEPSLRKLAGPTVEFHRRVSDSVLRDLYANCRAFLFAADEDFGIVPVEAQSYGRPVLAYGHGGSLETVVVGPNSAVSTGMYFAEQTVDALQNCILNFEQEESSFNPQIIRAHARKFDTQEFRRNMTMFIKDALEGAG